MDFDLEFPVDDNFSFLNSENSHHSENEENKLGDDDDEANRDNKNDNKCNDDNNQTLQHDSFECNDSKRDDDLDPSDVEHNDGDVRLNDTNDDDDADLHSDDDLKHHDGKQSKRGDLNCNDDNDRKETDGRYLNPLNDNTKQNKGNLNLHSNQQNKGNLNLNSNQQNKGNCNRNHQNKGNSKYNSKQNQDDLSHAKDGSVVAYQHELFVPAVGLPEEVGSLLGHCQAFAHFYELLMPLQVLERGLGALPHRVILHTVAVSAAGLLVAVADGNWRSTVLGSTDTASTTTTTAAADKVVVHHQYSSTSSASLCRYIAVHCDDNTLTVLLYDDLKEVGQYAGVSCVYSADVNNSGTPVLTMIKCSGERVQWSPLLSDGSSIAVPASATAAAPAQQQVLRTLHNTLRRSLTELARLERSCQQREEFIARHLATLRARRRGDATGHQITQGNLIPVASPAAKTRHTNDRLQAFAVPSGGLCSVSAVRWKILHNTLVVCAALHNTAHRQVLCNPELLLHWRDPAGGGSNSLHYSGGVYKSVLRRQKRGAAGGGDSGAPAGGGDGAGAGGGSATTTIEQLSPCILRPNKRAFVIARCELPRFVASRKAVLAGLLVFQTRPVMGTPTAHQQQQQHSHNDTAAHLQNSDNSAAKQRNSNVEKNLVDRNGKRTRDVSLSASKNLVASSVGLSKDECKASGNVSNASARHEVALSPITIDVLALDKSRVDFTGPSPSSGVSLDTVALVAGSPIVERVLLHTAVCPLDTRHLLQHLTDHCHLRRVGDVSNLHVFTNPGMQSCVLQHCAVSLTQHDHRATSALIYARDITQAMALIHLMKSLLPFDTKICASESCDNAHLRDICSITEEKARRKSGVCLEQRVDPSNDAPLHKVLETMQRITNFMVENVNTRFSKYTEIDKQNVDRLSGLVDGKKQKPSVDLEDVENTSSPGNAKKQKMSLSADGTVNTERHVTDTDQNRTLREAYKEQRRKYEAIGQGFTVSRDHYTDWMADLLKLQTNLDALYIDASEDC